MTGSVGKPRISGLTALPVVAMLTGYNTDIDRGDLVVHVQTEDKGLANPSVETLIYVGGRVVASKSSAYDDLLAEGAEQEAISRFMDRQHRKIVMAIRSGRLDDRIRRVTGAGAGRSRETPPAVAAEPPAQTPPTTEPAEAPLTTEPAEAPSIAEPARAPSTSPLALQLSSETPLVVGETVAIMIRASQGDKPVADVEIRAEMISTEQTPILIGSGVTDVDGLFRSDLAIPDIEGGTGAIIFRGRGVGSIAEIIELL